MYASRHPDGSLPNREDMRAAAANILAGYALAADPDGKLGLAELVRTLWRHPNPKLHAKPVDEADNGNTIENLSADLEKVQQELDQRERQVTLINGALAPFVDLGIATAEQDDHGMVAFQQMPNGRYADVEVRHVRALLRAAGLFTDEMQARPPNPGPDAKPEGATPPVERDDEPGTDGADASSDGDPQRGQRMDSADVGETDLDAIDREMI